MYKKPILNFSAISSLLCRRFFRLSILELYSQKWSECILLFIFKEFYFSWELYGKLFSDSHDSCVCVGKREVTLLYNWFAVFRLSIAAWNTEKQEQYQDSPILLFLVYYSFISLLWLYSLYFCKIYIYIYIYIFCHVDVRFPVFIIFLPYRYQIFSIRCISIRYVIIFAINPVQYWIGEDEYKNSITTSFCKIRYFCHIDMRFSVFIIYL
jgi:hypothetical protein